MNQYPSVSISEDMINEAKKLVPVTKVNRTIASRIDTLTGILGEFAFAQYFFGDWRQHHVGTNKGQVDFGDIEVKTSAFPFRESLNLLVREDYALNRKPAFYVQIILDIESSNASDIKPETRAFICGFATSSEVDAAPMRDFGSKFGGQGGYLCHYIEVAKLKPMNLFLEKRGLG